MALLKKLMCFNTQANFDAKLEAEEILPASIVFIKDTQKIWTHDTYFGDVSEVKEALTKIYTKEEVDSLINDLEKEISNLNTAVEAKQDKLSAGDNITITDNTISASQPTLSDLSGISTVSASGTSPLTLSASKSGTSVSISGSVDLSDYATNSTVDANITSLKETIETKQDKLSAGDNITISGSTISATDTGVTSVSASGTSPLTLSGSVSGRNLTISGSVDLSDYATNSTLESGLSKKQDVITAGTGLAFDGNTLNCTIDDELFVVYPNGLPTEPAAGDEHKIHLVPLATAGEDNKYAEYVYVDGEWEKFGELQANTDLSGYYTKSEIDGLLVKELSGYLPLTGGTLSGELTVNSSIYCAANLVVDANMTVSDEVLLKSDLTVGGTTQVSLLENSDASYIVTTDSDGILYRGSIDKITDSDIDSLF